VVALFSLWLRTGFPKSALSYALYDDALFVKQGRLLAEGHWLGPYNNLTLAKGAFFPFFMAVAHWVAIPLDLAEQALYLAVAAVTALVVRRYSGDRRLALLLFAALAGNPVFWDMQLSRVVREGIYPSLSLAAVTLLVPVAFPLARSPWLAAARGAAFGLVAAAFWLTREEGPWLLPACAVVLLAAVPGLLRRRERWLPVALSSTSAALVLGVVLGTVSAINWRHYGVFITNEFKTGPFQHAYGALARIQQDQWRRFVVFPKDARERAYQVSPAARELAAVLDGPIGDGWRNVGCSALQLADCPEILSGWFMWALRDAAAQAGHYGSGAEAMRFYRRVAREVDAACDAGRIACGPRRATLMPVFRWQYVGDTIRELPLVGRMTLELASAGLGSLPNDGPLPGIADFADLVGALSEPPGGAWFVRGWAASSAGRPVVSLRVRGDAAVSLELVPQAAPDVAAAFPGWSAVRFDLRATCPPAACDLVAAAPGAGEAAAAIDTLHAGQTVASPAIRLFVDQAEQRDPASLTTRRRAMQHAIARAIGRAYAAAAPVLSGVAVVGVLLALARLRARPLPAAMLALALASGAAVAARTLLLAYLDVTSIPSARVLYTSSATPFVIVFAVLGCWCGVRAVWPVRRA
jgi:hypothetical protein